MDRVPDDNDKTVLTRRNNSSPPTRTSGRPPSGNALPIGTRLSEFEIVGLVGEGGFGIVYLAEDHSLKRRVAIKEYMPAALATRGEDASVVVRSERHAETFETGRHSFVNEARLLARFDHPALLKVFRFWEANGTAYMAMPYYAGKTLREVLRERKGQAPDQAWFHKLLDPVMDALALMHAEHCFHRDIAPDNIMLLPNGRPVLLDFGAARRVISDMTQALTVILKPGYAPVEQYAEMPGIKQGPWTDIYALAAVVYCTITGHPPPPSVGRMLRDAYRPLAEIAAGSYSAQFLHAIDRCLSVKAEDRPQSIAEMRALLEVTESSVSEASIVTRANYADKDRGDAAQPVTGAPPDSERWTRTLPPTGSPEIAAAEEIVLPTQETVRTIAQAAVQVPAQVSNQIPAQAAIQALVQPVREEPIPPAVSPQDSPAPRSVSAPVQPGQRKTGLFIAAVGAVAVLAGGITLLRQPPDPAPAPAVESVSGAAKTPDGELPTGPAAMPPAMTVHEPVKVPPPVLHSVSPVSVEAAFAATTAASDQRFALKVDKVRSPVLIGKESLTFTLHSQRKGWVYLFLWDEATASLALIFPNSYDQNNAIDANKPMAFPRPDWAYQADLPKGAWRVLPLVSEAPRDFSVLRLNPETQSVSRKVLEAALTEAGQGGLALAGTPGCAKQAACSADFAALSFTVDEAADEERKKKSAARTETAAPASANSNKPRNNSVEQAEKRYVKELNKSLDKLLQDN